MKLTIQTLPKTIAFLVLIGGITLASVVSAAPPTLIKERPAAPTAAYTSGEVLVKFKNSNVPFDILPVPNVEAAVAALSKNPRVEFVQPNYLLTALTAPNDQYYSYQWNFDTFETEGGVGAEAAWTTTTGDNSVVVAVVDTGIAQQAPDFANTCFVPGYDFANNDSNPTDDEGHGTHVAGTIAQSTNNTIGVAGLAYDTCLMPVKVLSQNGSGSTADVALGIRYATDNGADVINLSLGGSGSPALQEAVAYAHNNGVTVVAATGNDGVGTVDYPAAYDEYVIAVGATRKLGQLAPYSNYGSAVDLVAPGGYLRFTRNGKLLENEGILQQTLVPGTTNQFSYYFYTGTSMAAPHVAAAAGLLLSVNNGLTPTEIQSVLQTTAHDLGNSGRDDLFGYGLLNIPGALAAIASLGDTPPRITIDTPLTGDTLTDTTRTDIVWTVADTEGIEEASLLIDGTVVMMVSATGTYTYSWDVPQNNDRTYVVSAVTTDLAGQTATTEVLLYVDNVDDAPIAVIVAPDTAFVDENIVFDGSQSYDDRNALSYDWSFSDGMSASGESVNRSFSAAGYYTALLTVTDSSGQSTSTGHSIVISDVPSLALLASGQKNRGTMTTTLNWTPVTTAVDVYRDSALVATAVSGGTHIDTIGKGGGTFAYQVCETGTNNCSNTTTVTY